MAKDKTDYSKLTLGKKKPIKKEAPKTPDLDRVVEQIHQPSVVATNSVSPPKPDPVPTKRITLDIPIPLHRKVRNRAYDLDVPMKQYFLMLAEKDLEELE